MNISSNPWSFISTDPATASITAATGLTLNADGTVTITTTGALTFNTSAESNLGFTVIGATNGLYNGFYQRLSGASGATSFVMIPQFVIPVGTAQSGSGTLIQCLYRHQVRAEDISWQNITTTGVVSVSLQLVDRSGNDVWRASIGATDTLAQLNRGKIYWINGLSPVVIPANSEVLITVN